MKLFTFHSGSIKGYCGDINTVRANVFTFHSGSIKGHSLKVQYKQSDQIYIPFWFY